MPRYITDADTMRVLSEYYHHRTDVQMNALTEAISRVPTADVIEAPRWVPVTERLPKIDKKHHCSKDVLAYLKDGGMCFTALEENIFGQTWFECERHPAFEEEMIVTHWMPLPKPPKEE